MQRSLFLLMVACLALASCKDVNLGADGVDAGGGKGGSSGSTGGTTGAGGAGGSASTLGTGGSTGIGGTAGATGGATSSSPNCAAVGCSPPPLCSEGCTATCGCCPCATGTRSGDLICTKSGCYDWAVAPDAAGLDQAVDAPQADARQGGAGGSGGTIGTGGFTGTGGTTGAGGTTASSPVDAGANSCNNPLPLQCGDRLNHSTLIQGRANVWSGYNCSQRAESGREAIYALQTTAACQVAVQLKNLTVDLDLFVLTGCAPGPYDKCSSTPLDLQTIETVNFTSQAGQPYFVVVDGYNDAAGTYTLQVDCTCNPDAGTSDGPQAGAMSTCTADEIATSPQTTTRRISPWTLALPTASGGAGGPSLDGGTDGSSGSGCTVQGGPPLLYQTVACQGTAGVRSSTGTVELAFDDGSTLIWDTTGITNPVQAPGLNGLGSVWVDYSYSSDSACGPPMCATFTQTQLSIRDREAGSLLWVGQEGDQADDVSDALVNELFGVTATKQPRCQFEFTAECQDTIRTVFDHVLQTAPAQRLQHAQLEHVVTPTGQYQVVWAYSEETHTPVSGYCEAVHLPHDRGLAASRL